MTARPEGWRAIPSIPEGMKVLCEVDDRKKGGGTMPCDFRKERLLCAVLAEPV